MSDAAPPESSPPTPGPLPDDAPLSVIAAFFDRLAPAFRHRDFRILWLGAFVSTIGTWMQTVAQDWLIVELTGSPWFNGLNNFLGQAPFLIFTLIGGVVADRYSRRHLLMGSQYVQMACALTLAWLIYFQQVHIWHVLTLSFVVGIAQAFGGPAYQSLIPTLVPRTVLPNAIAFNSIQFNLARMLGPTFAGVTLAAIGTAMCFGINAASFLVVIAALAMVRPAVTATTTKRQPMMEELRGGLAYVRASPTIRLLMLTAFLATFLALPLQTLLPIVVQQVFHKDASQFARMVTFSGAGAVSGALVMAWLGRTKRLGIVLLAGQLLLAVLIFAFAQSRNIHISEALLFAIGAVNIVVFSMSTSLVQMAVPDELRGRVVSIYMLAFRGGMPLGALVAGYAASRFDPTQVLTVNALLLLLVSVYFLFVNRQLHTL